MAVFYAFPDPHHFKIKVFSVKHLSECFSVNPDSEIYVKSKRTLSLPVNFKVRSSDMLNSLAEVDTCAIAHSR